MHIMCMTYSTFRCHFCTSGSLMYMYVNLVTPYTDAVTPNNSKLLRMILKIQSIVDTSLL